MTERTIILIVMKLSGATVSLHYFIHCCDDGDRGLPALGRNQAIVLQRPIELILPYLFFLKFLIGQSLHKYKLDGHYKPRNMLYISFFHSFLPFFRKRVLSYRSFSSPACKLDSRIIPEKIKVMHFVGSNNNHNLNNCNVCVLIASFLIFYIVHHRIKHLLHSNVHTLASWSCVNHRTQNFQQ